MPAAPERPASDEALSLNSSVVPPGAPVAATGHGCVPGAQVALSVDGAPAGQTIADGAGTFTTPVETSTLQVGHYQVAARCGTLLTAPLDIVLVSHIGTSTATGVVIVFFLALGLLIYRRRLMHQPTTRKRSS
ncbi:hypothetical protein [Nocardia nepalensis]|uniref:hypothetical protein n=1 Tax=Nocardia nepalensis TaxID=3375448 RepID=UPI003B6798E4